MFRPIRSYDNYISANIVLQKLEAEGIQAYLQDENTVTIDPILSNAIGGIKLMVYESQVERVAELLAAFEEAYKNAVVCPQCGSVNVQFIPQNSNPANWFSAIVTWLFGSYAIAVKKVYHCYNCDHEFEDIS